MMVNSMFNVHRLSKRGSAPLCVCTQYECVCTHHLTYICCKGGVAHEEHYEHGHEFSGFISKSIHTNFRFKRTWGGVR